MLVAETTSGICTVQYGSLSYVVQSPPLSVFTF